MLGLVALRLEVKVVVEGMVAAFADSGEYDGHIELTPALLVEAEGWLLDHCVRVSECYCQINMDCAPCLGFSNDGCKL